MNKHRAQHRLRIKRTQHWIPQVNLLWLLIPLSLVVCAGILTIVVKFVGPPSSDAQIATAATTVLARPDPATTETSRAFLRALAAEHVAIEPHDAVGYGGQVCYWREHFNSSPFTLQAQLRRQAPTLRPIDVATLVDKAAQYLCQVGK